MRLILPHGKWDCVEIRSCMILLVVVVAKMSSDQLPLSQTIFSKRSASSKVCFKGAGRQMRLISPHGKWDCVEIRSCL
jgi:hypothetical protein